MSVTSTEPSNPAASGRNGEPVLFLKNLAAGYHKTPVVRDLTLTAHAGEVVALLGANGAGKTTTVMTVAGVLSHLGGELSILGRPESGATHGRVRRGLGFVPEGRSVISSLTTEENLRLGRGPVELALEYVPELERLLKRKAGLLSGGEQQMLSLARTLAARPKVLLADELSLGLAPIIVHRLLGIIRKAADETGLAALIVEQQVRNVLALADYAYVLRRGTLVMEGSGADLRSRMDEVESHYLAANGEADLDEKG